MPSGTMFMNALTNTGVRAKASREVVTNHWQVAAVGTGT